MYRGLAFDTEEQANAFTKDLEDGVFESVSFMSTSSSKFVAQSFSDEKHTVLNVVLKIKSFSGVDISSVSHHEEEEEVLFLPKTPFRVGNVDTVDVGGELVTMVEMEEL